MTVKQRVEGIGMFARAGISVVILSGMLITGFLYFQPAGVAAEQHTAIEMKAETDLERYMISQNEKDKNERIERIERELARIRVQLANPNIEPWLKEQLLFDQDEWRERIACIRRNEC